MVPCRIPHHWPAGIRPLQLRRNVHHGDRTVRHRADPRLSPHTRGCWREGMWFAPSVDHAVCFCCRWFFKNISRNEANRRLLAPGNTQGSFLIRESETTPGEPHTQQGSLETSSSVLQHHTGLILPPKDDLLPREPLPVSCITSRPQFHCGFCCNSTFFVRLKSLQALGFQSRPNSPNQPNSPVTVEVFPAKKSSSFLISFAPISILGSYSLSIRDLDSTVGDEVKHYRIRNMDNGGFYITAKISFNALKELVQHYSRQYGFTGALIRGLHRD